MILQTFKSAPLKSKIAAEVKETLALSPKPADKLSKKETLLEFQKV
jgi:hypothetical protein